MNATGRFSRFMLWATLVFLYAPVLVLIVYSFNDSRFAVAWQGFTLRWYSGLIENPETLSALRNTLIVSVSSTLVSTVLGTLLAVGMSRYAFPGRGALELLLLLPIIVPDIIMGVSLLTLFAAVHFPLGRLTIILAHVSFQISFVTLVVRARLQDFPPSLVEAARDLGANELRTFRRVVLPLLGPGILAGALIALALSIDDFVITYFTAGAGASTLPVRIYSMVRRGVTPEVNALSTLLLAATLLVTWLAARARARGKS